MATSFWQPAISSDMFTVFPTLQSQKSPGALATQTRRHRFISMKKAGITWDGKGPTSMSDLFSQSLLYAFECCRITIDWNLGS